MANEKEYLPTSQIAKTALRLRSGDVILLAVEHTMQPYFTNDYLKTGKSLESSNLDRFIVKMNKKPIDGTTTSVRANLPADQVVGLWVLSEHIYKDVRLAPISAAQATQEAVKNTIATSLKNSNVTLCLDKALAAAKKAGSDVILLSEAKKELFALPGVIAAPIAKEYFEKYSKPVFLYAPPAKYFSTKNDDGENECYEISVSYHATNRMPIQIVIKNFWAPVDRKPDNTTQIMMSKAHDTKMVTTWMSLDEWFCTISKIKACWDEYATASFTYRYRKSLVRSTD